MIYILKNKERRIHSIRMMLWVILISIVLPFSGAAQIPDPPVPPRLVNDFADLIPPAQEALLERQLVGYDDSTSTQIVIVTMKDLGNYDISEFSYELGDKWGVGRAGKDNGIVITLSEKDRRVFIATGWGIEGYITDVQARQIIDQYMIPYFREGNYYEGFHQGTRVIAGLLSGTFDGERLKKEPQGPPIGSIFLLFLVIIIIVSAFRGGGGGGGPMSRRGWSGPIILGGGRGYGGGGGFGGGMGGGGGFGGFGGGGFGGGGAGGSW